MWLRSPFKLCIQCRADKQRGICAGMRPFLWSGEYSGPCFKINTHLQTHTNTHRKSILNCARPLVYNSSLCVPVCSGLGCIYSLLVSCVWLRCDAGVTLFWRSAGTRISLLTASWIQSSPRRTALTVYSLPVTRSPPPGPVDTQCQRVKLFCSFLCKR